MIKSEKGQALTLVLIAIALGALVIPGFLGHTGTNLIGSRVYADDFNAQYAADSGAERAIWDIYYGSLTGILRQVGDSTSYQMNELINGLTVDITATKTGSHTYDITATAGDRTVACSINTQQTVVISDWDIQ